MSSRLKWEIPADAKFKYEYVRKPTRDGGEIEVLCLRTFFMGQLIVLEFRDKEVLSHFAKIAMLGSKTFSGDIKTEPKVIKRIEEMD